MPSPFPAIPCRRRSLEAQGRDIDSARGVGAGCACFYRRRSTRHRRASGMLRSSALPQVIEAVLKNPAEIYLRLGDRRNSARRVHPLGAGVVGCHGERDAAAVVVEQRTEIPGATLDVLLGDEDVPDAF